MGALSLSRAPVARTTVEVRDRSVRGLDSATTYSARSHVPKFFAGAAENFARGNRADRAGIDFRGSPGCLGHPFLRDRFRIDVSLPIVETRDQRLSKAGTRFLWQLESFGEQFIWRTPHMGILSVSRHANNLGS